MNLIICAPLMQSDLWQRRLRRIAPSISPEFTELYSADDVRHIGLLLQDAALVLLPGDEGAEAVRLLRGKAPALPILWISDELRQGLTAFRLRVTMFLTTDCTDRELADALERCGIGLRERLEA